MPTLKANYESTYTAHTESGSFIQSNLLSSRLDVTRISSSGQSTDPVAPSQACLTRPFRPGREVL